MAYLRRILILVSLQKKDVVCAFIVFSIVQFHYWFPLQLKALDVKNIDFGVLLLTEDKHLVDLHHPGSLGKCICLLFSHCSVSFLGTITNGKPFHHSIFVHVTKATNFSVFCTYLVMLV